MKETIEDLRDFIMVFNDPKTNLLVNKEGKFYDTRLNKFREPKYLMGRGYLRISIKGEHHLMHRVIKLTYDPISNPDIYDVHHKDEIKTNNELDNLEYILKGEHSSSHNKGSGNGRSVLTEEAAYFIKYDSLKYTVADTIDLTYEIYNILPNKNIIHKIRNGITWKYL